ncbi:MAG: hypothetical protein FJ144_12850 [Deltaproteobacteria bacterium]|nr:hypothetical protein [Deltaproteobacteria bacterium]
MGSKGQGGGNNDEQCMRLRRGTAAQIWQTICFNWTTSGVSVRDTSTFDVACEPNGTQNLSGDLMVKESILFNAGAAGKTY